MEHSFDVEIATEYSVNIAIFVKNFDFWLSKNKANNKNFAQNTWWTYNSVKAFSLLFPYLTKKQISSTLGKMKDFGIIQSGNHNSNPYDRTAWYTFTDKFAKRYSCILQFGKMEKPELSNVDLPELSNHYTDNKPDINTDNRENKEIRGYKKQFKPPTHEELSEYIKEQQCTFSANHFFDYYEAKGWMIGKNKMKDWKAAVRLWKNNDNKYGENKNKESGPAPAP